MLTNFIYLNGKVPLFKILLNLTLSLEYNPKLLLKILCYYKHNKALDEDIIKYTYYISVMLSHDGSVLPS